ncbi:MAG TPA: hypothetical protein VKA60_27590 [Blastocatellia bacterium]|nr:hypothetical protein [Blastocatellia bacterium]
MFVGRVFVEHSANGGRPNFSGGSNAGAVSDRVRVFHTMGLMRQNDLTVIVGKKNCGKSSRARSLALTRPRRIYIDPMHEYLDGVIIRDFASLASYLRSHVHDKYAIVFRSMNDAEILAAIAIATRGSPENPPLPGVTYIIDEADRLCSARSIPEPIHRLANYGRHFRASAIFIARRAKMLPGDIRANADRYIIGQTFEPGDVDYMREYIGDEKAAAVQAIPPRKEGEAGVFVEWPDDDSAG